MTNAERNAEMDTRRNGLRKLDRKNLVANFTAYWPGQSAKGVHRNQLEAAIILAEFQPTAKLSALNGTVWG